ncbi:MAG: NADH-quinone oxidoreductase subunit A, partial [Planctomycetes bacterium]|nr:NADH-quinone oxidoreductase subunit A [Planctomycetota bacterium]
LGPRRGGRVKEEAYECGEVATGKARTRFSVHFYLVAILFVLFDIEAVFLLPWAVIYRDLGVFGLVEVGIFVGVLALGLFYAWKRGVLEWGSSRP